MINFQYRKEAFETSGAPRIMPRSWISISYFFAFILAAIVMLLLFGSILRKETVSGVLTASGGEIRIVPSKAGTISAVYVSDGQLVKKNQALIRVTTQQEGGRGDTSQQITQSIDDQIQALKADMAATQAEYLLEKARLEASIKNKSEKIQLQKVVTPQLERKLEVQRSIFESGKGLASEGALSTLQARDFENNYIDAQNAIQDHDLNIVELRESLAQDQAAIAKLPLDLEKSRQNSINQIALLQEKYATVQESHAYLIQSSIDGKITFLQASVGDQADVMHPVAAVLPVKGDMYAQLYVPSRAIGFIKVGQDVRLMYDAFPYQRFGVGRGVVAQISSTVLNPGQIETAAPINEPVYLVNVRLLDKSIQGYGQQNRLEAGMALTADVILERQSLLRLIFEPINAVRVRS